MGEDKSRKYGRLSSPAEVTAIALEVTGLLQQQMDTLIDIPLADWSPVEWDQYRRRRGLIRELRSELEKTSRGRPN
jgi:hypothetical protein